MSNKIEVFLTLFVSLAICNAVELPEYIKACSRHDPNLNECFKKNANLALETLQHGDTQFNVTLDTFKMFDSLTLKPLPTLPFTLTMKDCYQFGVDKARVQNAKVDLVKRHFEIGFFDPLIVWRCQYEAQTGTVHDGISASSGSFNITFANGQYMYNIDYNLKDVNGEEYIDVTSHSVDILSIDMQLEFEDMENDSVVHRAWKQAEPHFPGDTIRQACSVKDIDIFNKFFKVVPYNKIFLP